MYESIKNENYAHLKESAYKYSFNRHFNILLNFGKIKITGYKPNKNRKPEQTHVDYENLLVKWSEQKDSFNIRKMLTELEKGSGDVNKNIENEIRTRFKRRLNETEEFEKDRWNRLNALTFYTTPKSIKKELNFYYSPIQCEIESLNEKTIQKLLIMYFNIPEQCYTPIDIFEEVPPIKIDLKTITKRAKEMQDVIWKIKNDHGPSYDNPLDSFREIGDMSLEEDNVLYSSLMKKHRGFQRMIEEYGIGLYRLGVLISLLPFYEAYRCEGHINVKNDTKIWFYPISPQEFQNIWYKVPTPQDLRIPPEEAHNGKKTTFKGFFTEMILTKPFKMDLSGVLDKTSALCLAGFPTPTRKYGDNSPFQYKCFPRHRKFPTSDFAFKYIIDIISTYSNDDKEVLWGILAKALSDETGALQVFIEFYNRIENVHYGNRLNSVLGIIS